MKFILINLLLIVCLLELARGFDYDEDDIRTVVKRQANYYNNYDYNAETTTVATTKKKLIKKCPTNAAGKRIKCKKKKRKTTTTSTTPQPAGLPPSFLRGPPGINPISFFIGPGGLFGNSETTKSVNFTTMSTPSTTKVTSTTGNNVITTIKIAGNFVGMAMMTGNVLPTGSPLNSTFSHVSADLVSSQSLNISAPGENSKLSPAGALQLGMLPKMLKSFETSTSTNVDPIVSEATVDSTTPINLATTTGLISKVGSFVAPIGSSGLPISGLNFFMPSIPTNSSQNITTTAKPAGLSNVTNSISSTINPSTSTLIMTSTTTLGLRPILRDLPMKPILNLTSAMSVITSNNTTTSPILTTVSSNMGSLLGRVGLPPGLPVANMPVSSTLQVTTTLPNITPLTTASSSMGSLLGKIGLPFGVGSSLAKTTATPISAPQTVLPSSTSTIKTASVLPSLGTNPVQSTIGLSSSTVTPSTTVKLGLLLPLLPGPGSLLANTTVLPPNTTAILTSTTKSGLLLPLQPGGTLLSTTTVSPSNTTVSISSTKNSLSTIVVTTTISKQNTTLPNTATTLKNLATTIGSAANGTSPTKSNGLTTIKSSKTTKKEVKKSKKPKKQKKSKKTTKKAGNQQNGNKQG